MDALTACLICEGEQEANAVEIIAAWQSLVDSGIVWSLQGWYGRTAKDMIEKGILIPKN